MGYPKQITIPEIHAKREQGHMMKAEFNRDMRRLLDLRNQYDSRGMNTYESNEVKELLGKYDIDYNQWTRREMFKDD